MSFLVSASGTPSAMTATTRIVGCIMASMLDSYALHNQGERSESIIIIAITVCACNKFSASPIYGPNHPDDWPTCWFNARTSSPTSVQSVIG